jgi:hypothetical protein
MEFIIHCLAAVFFYGMCYVAPFFLGTAFGGPLRYIRYGVHSSTAVYFTFYMTFTLFIGVFCIKLSTFPAVGPQWALLAFGIGIVWGIFWDWFFDRVIHPRIYVYYQDKWDYAQLLPYWMRSKKAKLRTGKGCQKANRHSRR